MLFMFLAYARHILRIFIAYSQHYYHYYWPSMLNKCTAYFKCSIKSLFRQRRTEQHVQPCSLLTLHCISKRYCFSSCTEGFLTPDLFHSTSFASCCCFSAKIEKSSKISEIEQNKDILGVVP